MRVLEVEGRYRRDGVRGDRFRAGLQPQRDERQDRQLRARVESVDVLRRIRLGESQRLRLPEGGVELGAFRFDAREDVVARTVEDARDLSNGVARETALDRAD